MNLFGFWVAFALCLVFQALISPIRSLLQCCHICFSYRRFRLFSEAGQTRASRAYFVMCVFIVIISMEIVGIVLVYNIVVYGIGGAVLMFGYCFWYCVVKNNARVIVFIYTCCFCVFLLTLYIPI